MLNLLKLDDGSFWISWRFPNLTISNAITNQSEKSINVNIGGQTYTYYNSAILALKDAGYWQCYIIIILDQAATAEKHSSWGVLDTAYIGTNYGDGCYSSDTWTLVPYGSNTYYILNIGGYGDYYELSSDLPVFYTIEEFNSFTRNPLISYQWTSVPAISGKNGILSLPTLVDTDGNPISGQSASAFSSLPEGSNVRTLINGAL